MAACDGHRFGQFTDALLPAFFIGLFRQSFHDPARICAEFLELFLHGLPSDFIGRELQPDLFQLLLDARQFSLVAEFRFTALANTAFQFVGTMA